MTYKVLALDLESTLITNVIHRQARPGLKDFLRFCLDSFEKVVIFTGTSEEMALSTISELNKENLIPEDFLARADLVDWDGWYKDLRYIKGYDPEEILIADDFADYILPEQKSQWIRVQPYLPEGVDRWAKTPAHAPDPADPDRELERVQALLEKRLKEDHEG